ncbi:shikimate dehydrogenase [Streptomyces aurantiacus]|uniref:Shikimate dehydrogenase (NADP(+)) n=1 Tax=Streptomyces aurantiacus TaxID=47760 RepID=A0A7G1NY08_9ACTN|nr:shikimate dehydrogenase [Streptomyces aurantiacus]BCL26416.1 shikimate dehydrogenase (NADP(+)) [Streptomyces aurantiacus]
MVKDSYLVGLIGAGIGPSLSPALHEREADRQGLRYVYRLIDMDALGVAPDAVGDLVRAARDLGFDGLNITHPCKQLVIEHLDALAPQAEALGAVNTVVFEGGRAVGHNTDVTGFAASFARGLPDAPLERVLQLGAGGAGAAVAHALLTLGAGHVTVVDALPDRAADLAAALNRHFGVGRAAAAGPDGRMAALLDGADGVVHATPTGMAAHPGVPFAVELLRPGLWVAEVVYRPLETGLLRAARGVGCATLDGGGMAVFQAADAFRLFTGREPDVGRMLLDIAELAGAAGAAGAWS